MNDHPPTAKPLVFITAFAAAAEGAIQAYHLDLQTGHLEATRRTSGLEHPFFLTLSRTGRFLYSTHARTFGGAEPEEVAAFEVVDRTGELRFLNRQSAFGTAACYLDIDATGKTVLVANYASGSVAALPVREDGSLGPAVSFFQHAATAGEATRPGGPHAHCLVVSPDNRFAYAADLGLDQVRIYRLNATRAELAAQQPPWVRTPPGSGPRHLTFHPNGRQVYVINELGNSITRFDLDAESDLLHERQTISTVPAGFAGKSYCADLKITPDGRFLYGTNRGHDSVAMFRLDEAGCLALIGSEPSLGRGPQNLALAPGGELLLCANLPGNSLTVFRIDPQTGRLSPVGAPTAMPSPSCIMVLA
jgi:6-phosphogluconolactonase